MPNERDSALFSFLRLNIGQGFLVISLVEVSTLLFHNAASNCTTWLAGQVNLKLSRASRWSMVQRNDAIGGLGRFLMGLEAQCTALICVILNGFFLWSWIQMWLVTDQPTVFWFWFSCAGRIFHLYTLIPYWQSVIFFNAFLWFNGEGVCFGECLFLGVLARSPLLIGYRGNCWIIYFVIGLTFNVYRSKRLKRIQIRKRDERHHAFSKPSSDKLYIKYDYTWYKYTSYFFVDNGQIPCLKT